MGWSWLNDNMPNSSYDVNLPGMGVCFKLKQNPWIGSLDFNNSLASIGWDMVSDKLQTVIWNKK